MRAGLFKSEAELAAVVVGWLQDQEWEVYQEVQVGGWIADIVARRGRLTWAIEAKLSYGSTVLEQAARWIGMANLVAVAVPHVGSRRGASVLSSYCRVNGIGVLVANHPDDYCSRSVDERRAPKLQRRISDRLVRHLHEEQKTWAPAGNADGQRFSPFKATCRALADHVRRNPGRPIREAVTCIDHHYSTSATAKSALLQWIRRGVVPGVRLDESTKPITLQPEETG